METLNCHSNQSTYATAKKKKNCFVEAHAMNNSAKFQLYPPSEELIFRYKFSILIAMTTNQIERFEHKIYV